MFSKFMKLLTPLQWVELLLLIVVLSTAITAKNDIVEWVQTKFGMETKANLKEQVINKEIIIKDIQKANKEFIIAIDKQIESSKVDNTIIADKFKAEIKVDLKFDKIIASKNKDIKEINKQFETKPVTLENTVEKEKEISLKQINSLWDLYCTDTENSIQCNNNKVVT